MGSQLCIIYLATTVGTPSVGWASGAGAFTQHLPYCPYAGLLLPVCRWLAGRSQRMT
jgi:hypothetical protein